MAQNFDEPKLREIVEKLFKGSNQCDYFNHTLRVVVHSKTIGSKEGADLNILIPAAYLHDVGRVISQDLTGHVEKSILLAKLVLSFFGYNEKEISEVVVAIKDHNISEEDPSTLEGKVLFDADKLELVGNIGIAIWFKSLGATGTGLETACKRYLNLAESVANRRQTFFYTKTAKELGDKSFFESINFFKSVLSSIHVNYSR